MMEVKWSSKALYDLVRLHDLLAPINEQAAAGAVQSLMYAPERLVDRPRIGEKLENSSRLKCAASW